MSLHLRPLTAQISGLQLHHSTQLQRGLIGTCQQFVCSQEVQVPQNGHGSNSKTLGCHSFWIFLFPFTKPSFVFGSREFLTCSQTSFNIFSPSPRRRPAGGSGIRLCSQAGSCVAALNLQKWIVSEWFGC